MVSETKEQPKEQTVGFNIPYTSRPELSWQARIVIDLPPEAYAELEKLVRRTGDDYTQLFQKALALYKLAKDAVDERKSVGVANTPDCLETRFTGI